MDLGSILERIFPPTKRARRVGIQSTRNAPITNSYYNSVTNILLTAGNLIRLSLVSALLRVTPKHLLDNLIIVTLKRFGIANPRNYTYRRK